MRWLQRLSTLFPYTTLFRSDPVNDSSKFHFWSGGALPCVRDSMAGRHDLRCASPPSGRSDSGNFYSTTLLPQDRKSTRLNSSHTVTSYAVFCLKIKITIL